MTKIFLRSLQLEDLGELVEFETINRSWFERHIDPRPAQFYSMVGVRAHINALLDAYTKGTFHASVLVNDSGVIVGRANLKDIQQELGIAEIGYRIGQRSVGQGYATLALAALIALARQQWQLRQLIAYVTENNLASARVLQKQGFVRTERVPNIAVVAGVSVDGYLYSLDLSQNFH